MCEQHWIQVSMTIFGTLNYRRYICSFFTGGFPITFFARGHVLFFRKREINFVSTEFDILNHR